MTDIDVWVVSRQFTTQSGWPSGETQIMGAYLDQDRARQVMFELSGPQGTLLSAGSIERTKLEVPDGFKLG
jgi:hypothetical protein